MKLRLRHWALSAGIKAFSGACVLASLSVLVSHAQTQASSASSASMPGGNAANPVAQSLAQRTQALPLSAWLLNQSAVDGAYPLGLIWATPEERAQQVGQQRAWLGQLERLRTEGRIGANTWLSMQRMMRALSPTGRVRLPAADLEA